MARVLIIDDDDRVRASLRLMLLVAGHETWEARNGREGLTVLGAYPADLVLCDLFMPEKDGLETIRELHQQFPDMPIIAMSGDSALVAVDLLPIARALGAADTLSKPIHPPTLLAAVHQSLHRAAITRRSA